MGWTYYHCQERKPNGAPDVKAEIDKHVLRGDLTILKSAMVGSTYYAAARNPGSDDVWAAVFLTAVDRSGYCDFGYKDMDESMGPTRFQCPASILRLLTPTDDERANMWRARCWKAIEERKWFDGIGDGEVVTWTAPFGALNAFAKGDRVQLRKGPLKRCAKRSKRVWHVVGKPYYVDRALVHRCDVA